MTTPAAVDIGSLIETIPGVNGGKPVVSGVGVSVEQLSVFFNAGESPEQIATHYDGLTVALVYAAIAHYLANKTVIDTELEAEIALAQQIVEAYPDGVGPNDSRAALDRILAD